MEQSSQEVVKLAARPDLKPTWGGDVMRYWSLEILSPLVTASRVCTKRQSAPPCDRRACAELSGRVT